MTHSYMSLPSVWDDAVIRESYKCVIWHIHMWVLQVCDIAHSNVSHVIYIDETWSLLKKSQIHMTNRILVPPFQKDRLSAVTHTWMSHGTCTHKSRHIHKRDMVTSKNTPQVPRESRETRHIHSWVRTTSKHTESEPLLKTHQSYKCESYHFVTWRNQT